MFWCKTSLTCQGTCCWNTTATTNVRRIPLSPMNNVKWAEPNHTPPKSQKVGKKSPQMIWNRHLINVPPIKVGKRLTLHAIYTHFTPSFWPICPQLRPEECKDKVTHAIHIGATAIILRTKNTFCAKRRILFFSKCQRTARECRLLF